MKHIETQTEMVARRTATEIILGGLVVVAFGVGLLLGGMVYKRKVEPELTLGRACMERMGEAVGIYNSLAASVQEVFGLYKKFEEEGGEEIDGDE